MFGCSFLFFFEKSKQIENDIIEEDVFHGIELCLRQR